MAPRAPWALVPRAATLSAPTSGHPCPALSYPPMPEGTGKQRWWPLCGDRSQGRAHPDGLKARVWREGEGSHGGGRVQLPTVLMAVAVALPRDRGRRKRKYRPGARARRVAAHRCPAAACTSHGLLHRKLEPARRLCLLPVSRPALPSTVRLTQFARRLESPGGAGGARPRHSGRWGPPLAGSTLSSAP